jgi:hypothetical protein
LFCSIDDRPYLSVREFAYLNGERWTQSFRSRLGLRARKLYKDLYGKNAKLKRGHATFRNRVGKYPCGMLELALRTLRAEEAAAATVSAATAESADSFAAP